MTDLLAPRSATASPDSTAGRPLALVAAAAGLTAAAATLVVCMAVALFGWFAADGGAHGDTRDALRVGTDAWLLGHGARLEIAGATITAVPLGITLLCGLVLHRLGRATARSAAATDDRGLGVAVLLLTTTYAVTALVAAVLASLGAARPSAGLAFLGAFVLAALAGGGGLVVGTGRAATWVGRVPTAVRAVSTAAVATVALLLAAAALTVAVALCLDFDTAANVLARLHSEPGDALMFVVVTLLVTPNAVLFGASYLTGAGFTVGTATVVSPSVVSLGPVPAFPLLAALPDDGPTAGWTVGLLAVPALCAAVAVGLTQRRYPVTAYDTALLRALVSGIAAGLLLGVLSLLGGGAVGPGRMADVAPNTAEILVAAPVAMGLGAGLAGLVCTWWHRRAASA